MFEWQTRFAVGYQYDRIDSAAPGDSKTSDLEVELFSPVELDLSFFWDRVDDSEKEKNDDTPDSNDFRMSVGLAIES